MNSADDPKRPIRILAVDDNPAALYATSRVLRSAGFNVSTATTGGAALASAPEADLIVLDVNLPDIDGFEVCRRLRASSETARIPVLHLSATFTQPADLDIGLAAGADSYLTRPVEPAVLIAAVRTLLFARRADSQRIGLGTRLRTMFELSPSGMAILDRSFRFENVNASLGLILGIPTAQLIGTALAEMFALNWSEVANKLNQHERWQGELPIVRPDGSVRHVDWRIVREPLATSYFVTATDVSLHRQHEEEREQLLTSERLARSEAERGNRLKEEFLATLSHELRNPLNAILGWANVLTKIKGLPPQVAAAIEAIERNGKLQANMIGDLLDYAGISFGKLRLVLTPINPYQSVRSAIEIMQPAAAAKKIRLECTFGEEPLRVQGDAGRLQQVIWNLLSNAIKFSTEGSVVRVAASKQGDFVEIAVQDAGQGISVEFLPRVFERFSQADATTTRRQGGLGIGLAIAKQLIEAQDGSLEAFSQGEGKGATFVIKLPLSNVESGMDLLDSQLQRTLDLSSARILLVEDDRDARQLIRRILSDVGAEVMEAADAKTALMQIADNAANFLISDIGMPVTDGYQLLRELRSRGHDAATLPAIALTAFTGADDRERALAAGFQDHLTKPVQGHLLVARVAALLPRLPRQPSSPPVGSVV